ncbi:MAG: phosphoglucosamine mutase [Elusimicrobiota bacterium]|jgi:phosphoglucosamine mutase
MATHSLFGTDGVRGIPGQEPLTDRTVERLGFSAAGVFLERLRRAGGKNAAASPRIIIGRDTRGSGPRLMKALVSGFERAGCSSVDIGVAPTPAVSYCVSRTGALCGAVVSASHNPSEFNGIKFFTGAGYKAPLDVESEIAARMDSLPELRGRLRGARAQPCKDAMREYLDFLKSTFPADLDLQGRRIVVDAAHGAGYAVAAELFRSLGAQVFSLGDKPNGRNINEGCGALSTDALRREVVRRRAHCGIALDGDADRAVFSDEHGRLLDGDVLIAMSALHLHEQGRLRKNAVVLTVMSNYGLVRWLEERGILVEQVPVGDRNVTDALEKGGYDLGGENSGHVVFRSFAPTGDGLLTALQTLAVWASSGRPLSAFRSLYRPYPQILKNVRVERRVPVSELPGFQRSLHRAERQLAGQGRVFVRYSGTEPLLRILVEGPQDGVLRRMAAGLEQDFIGEVAKTLAGRRAHGR